MPRSAEMTHGQNLDPQKTRDDALTDDAERALCNQNG